MASVFSNISTIIDRHTADLLFMEKLAEEGHFTQQEWVRYAQGANTTLETVLHTFKCYTGFRYISKSGIGVTPDHPDFRENRRQYFKPVSK